MLRLSNRLKILLITLVLLTGCTAKYDITINDMNDLNESLDIMENDKTKFDIENEELYNVTLKEYLQTDLKWPTPVYINSEENPIEPKELDNVDYYKKEDKSTNELLQINYSFQHNQNNYSKSNIVNTCYDYEFGSKNNYITFTTTSDFKCFEKYKLLDSVEFSLNTTCKVKNANYDKKVDNSYTWNITKETINKKISFSLDCSKEKKDDFNLSVAVITCSYIFIILFLILMLKIIFNIKNRL